MIGLGWARATVNGRVGKLKLAFRWAASRELVPVVVSEGLRTLPGLRRGRTPARETAAVIPVEEELDRLESVAGWVPHPATNR